MLRRYVKSCDDTMKQAIRGQVESNKTLFMAKNKT